MRVLVCGSREWTDKAVDYTDREGWLHQMGGVDYGRGYTFGYYLEMTSTSYHALTERERYAYWWGWSEARREWVQVRGRRTAPRRETDSADPDVTTPPATSRT